MTQLLFNDFEAIAENGSLPGTTTAVGAGMKVISASALSTTAISGTKIYGQNSDGYAVVFSGIGAIGDQEVTTHFRLSTLSSPATIAHALRCNSDLSHCYRAIIQGNGTALGLLLSFYNAGNTTVASPTYNIAAAVGDAIHLSTKMVGNVLESRLWVNGATKPTSPTATWTDASNTFATGMVGLQNQSAGTWAWIDDIEITDAAVVVDTNPPTLTSPTGAATGNTTASATVSTDEGAGTIWCLTNTAATATASAVKAGTSQAVTATGVQTFASRTGLTADTLYYNHFVQDDAAGTPNTSSVANSASFRTTGAVTFSGPVPTRNGVVGVAASFANASFFASAFTLTYTLQAGTLPAGLTLGSSTGIISGTPTTAGTSSGIVIRATDTNSNTADTNAYSIVVAATNASPTFPGTISNISGTAGSAITPVNVSGQFSDTDALTYTASSAGTTWPSTLVVNPSTGIISGTVAGAGTTTGMKVRATDTASQTVDSNAFNAVIAAAPVDPTVDILNDLGQRVALSHGQGALPLVSVPGKVQFLSKTDLTAAPLANVSKTTNADGTITPWAQAGLTAGVLVTLRWISDADGHEGYHDVIPA